MPSKWQQSVIAAYHDYRYRQVLEPLYGQFQRWQAGALSHLDLVEAIHQAHKQNQQLYGFFAQKSDFLANAIQLDRAWFDPWLADHPPPPDIELVLRITQE